jgi:hypothetical protein
MILWRISKRGHRTTRRLVQAIEQPQKLHVGDVP